MSKAKERLNKRAANQGKPPEPEKKAAEAPKAAAPPEEGKSSQSEDDEMMGIVDKKAAAPAEEEAAAPAEAKAGETPAEGKTKVNPWDLVKEHKGRASNLEREVAELRKLVPNAEARKAEMEEIASLKKHASDLEKHLKFVDYQASEEYKQTYEKPYEQQWVNSMKELRGVTVTDESGADREIQPADLLDLVNMPTAKARLAAKEMFGEDLSQDVMIERDKIRSMNDARLIALNKAREEGVTQRSAAEKASKEQIDTIRNEVSTIYKGAVDSFSAMPNMTEFLKPIEGDEAANKALNLGYEMVDEAFAKSPMDPNLTPAERARVVKMHAAVRHRSAAFGRARFLLNREREAHEQTKKKLAAFESTVPNRGGSETASTSAVAGGSKMEQMLARLSAKASR